MKFPEGGMQATVPSLESVIWKGNQVRLRDVFDKATGCVRLSIQSVQTAR